MSFPNSLIELANGISDKQKVIASSLAGKSSGSFSQSASYVNSQGAGASSSSSAKSPAGNSSNDQQTIFVAGATSSSASASASSSIDDANTSVHVTVPAEAIENKIQPIFHIGSGQNDLIRTTDGQDFITGYAGSDIFDLVSDSENITDIANADIITDFDISEDYLLIPDSLTVNNLDFRSIDFNGDTVVDSTVIRLQQDGTILAVVLNTVLPIVNGQEQIVKLDADSSDTLNALVEYPIDYLLGTPAKDILVSDGDRDILIGYGNADTFVLRANEGNQLADADIIIDFDPDEGDIIQLSSEISFDSDIILETIDLDDDGMVESTSIYLTNGTVLAIAQGTVDLLGNTILSSDAFVSGAVV